MNGYIKSFAFCLSSRKPHHKGPVIAIVLYSNHIYSISRSVLQWDLYTWIQSQTLQFEFKRACVSSAPIVTPVLHMVTCDGSPHFLPLPNKKKLIKKGHSSLCLILIGRYFSDGKFKDPKLLRCFCPSWCRSFTKCFFRLFNKIYIIFFLNLYWSFSNVPYEHVENIICNDLLLNEPNWFQPFSAIWCRLN